MITITAFLKAREQMNANLKLPVTIGGFVVAGVSINEEAHLVFTLADGTEIDVGFVRGNSFIYSDFTPEQLETLRGPQGIQGIQGVPGAAGTNGVDGEDATTEKAPMLYVGGVLKVEVEAFGFIAPFPMTIIGVSIGVKTAPTGASLIVDINKNGTTMYTTQANRPTLVENDTFDAADLPDVVSIAKDDKITLDVDQIGSTVAGENLMVTIVCEV